MSTEVLLLVATGVLAVVAVVAAAVAVRAVRRLDRTPHADPAPSAPASPVPALPAPVRADTPVRIVEGRVIAAPTEQQVVATALGRPAARLSIYAAGLAHALRPESRDRIAALVRREYRHRRRTRLRVARRAARAVPARALHPDATWLGAPEAQAPRSLTRAVRE